MIQLLHNGLAVGGRSEAPLKAHSKRLEYYISASAESQGFLPGNRSSFAPPCFFRLAERNSAVRGGKRKGAPARRDLGAAAPLCHALDGPPARSNAQPAPFRSCTRSALARAEDVRKALIAAKLVKEGKSVTEVLGEATD